MRSISKIMALGIFLSTAIMIPASAAPVMPQDGAAIRALVQRTWARFGTTGVPHGPRYDPPRTAEFTSLNTRCNSLNRGQDDEACAPDNPYCLCWNEYRPYAGGVQIVGVNPNVIDARVSILLGGNPGPSTQTAVMRFVRSSGGWLLDDVFNVDRRGNKENMSLKEKLKINIDEMR